MIVPLKATPTEAMTLCSFPNPAEMLFVLASICCAACLILRGIASTALLYSVVSAPNLKTDPTILPFL